MPDQAWRQSAEVLKELFLLETSPVAVVCTKEKPMATSERKVRICRAILDASKGKKQVLDKENNACFGATWHLGFRKKENPRVRQMTKKFVVEGEKLFSSYEALDNLISQIEDVPDNAEATFVLTPMEEADIEPQIVIFVCNPEQACRILTFVTFVDGRMPKIKIGGPTCRMAVMS